MSMAADFAHSFCLFTGISQFLLTIILALPLPAHENYIVHMDLSAMPKAFSGQHSWYMATLASALQVSETATTAAKSTTTTAAAAASKLLYSYKHVINGFSASLTPSELEALKNSPGFISFIKDSQVRLDTTYSTKFLGLASDAGAWNVSSHGEGIIVGVIDTGVWPESKSYNDHGMPEIPHKWKGECESGTQFNSSMCNKKLIGARSFSKGLIAKKRNATIAMNSTRDTDGHGTHTSSTVAGNSVEGASFFGYAAGTAVGVAPRAHVAVYKVFFDEGNSASDIIAAIDQAISDGVDVLSMSLGVDNVPLHTDPVALATFAAVEKNIFVSISAGNNGPFLGSLHNGIPWVLTVAAGTMDREFGAVVTLGNGASVFGLSLYPGNFSARQVRIVFMGTCLNVKELKKVGRKLVVCQANKGSLISQFRNILGANVTGVIFITNDTDIETFLTIGLIPAVFINPNNGKIITDYIKGSSKPQARLEFHKTMLGTKLAPNVASYSSRGPSKSCPYVLKPDLMAPGALVLASWTPKDAVADANSLDLFSNFNLISGTSMACPHAAGVGVLVKKAHPAWSPAAIRSAMMTTADAMDLTQGPIKDIGHNNQPATPLAVGAGQVNPNKALDPGLVYDLTSTDYVNLLCALNLTQKQIQIITRSSSNNCSNPNLDLNYPSFIAFFNANGSKSDVTIAKEFHRTVTNVGKGMSTYQAKLTGLNGLNVSVVPDRLEFKAKNEKQNYKLIIQGPGLLKDNVIFGYLSWVDDGAKHVVNSPIVATSVETKNMTPM